MAFMVSNMLSVSASINLILQVPLQAPVMKRELANKMYSPTAYFFGCFLTNLMVQFIHPIIMVMMLYYTTSIAENKDNLMWFLAYAQISNFIFCGQGFFLGIMILDEDTAKLINLLFLMMWITGNGIMASAKHPNWFVNAIEHISPARFNCEGIFRRVS